MTDTGPGDPPEPTESTGAPDPPDASGAMTPQELAAARRKLRLGFDEEPELDEGDVDGDAGREADARPMRPQAADPRLRRRPRPSRERTASTIRTLRPRRPSRPNPARRPRHRSAAHRQLQRLLRRPDLRGPRDGRRRADRRAHRRLAGRAHDDDPGQGPHEGPRPRVRHDVPHPDGAGARRPAWPRASSWSATPAGSTRPGAPTALHALAARLGLVADHRLRRRRRPHAAASTS